MIEVKINIDPQANVDLIKALKDILNQTNNDHEESDKSLDCTAVEISKKDAYLEDENAVSISEVRNLDAEDNALKGMETDSSDNNKEFEDQFKSLKVKLDEKDAQILTLKNENAKAVSEIKDLKEKIIEVCNERDSEALDCKNKIEEQAKSWKEKLDEKDAQISAFKNENTKVVTDNKNLKNEVLDALNKMKKKEIEHEKELKAQANFWKEKLVKKEKDINMLNKSLESFSDSFGIDDPSQKIFFEVVDYKIEESMISSDSLYFAIKKDDSYSFTINTEGPIKKAISNLEKEIKPFCIIMDSAEGANTINIVEVGQVKSLGSQWKIVEKVKISLIKL